MMNIPTGGRRQCSGAESTPFSKAYPTSRAVCSDSDMQIYFQIDAALVERRTNRVNLFSWSHELEVGKPKRDEKIDRDR
jgi:hypothetical protein